MKKSSTYVPDPGNIMPTAGLFERTQRGDDEWQDFDLGDDYGDEEEDLNADLKLRKKFEGHWDALEEAAREKERKELEREEARDLKRRNEKLRGEERRAAVQEIVDRIEREEAERIAKVREDNPWMERERDEMVDRSVAFTLLSYKFQLIEDALRQAGFYSESDDYRRKSEMFSGGSLMM